ncbi:DUF192 domain-containing protein [Sulfitobacter sp. 1A13353]|uniref:DUF192 domain-containing protein n=1 Tax=Sulfitobacter sp. 1A13353 TaxID=3368568 RepID=UPI00374529ED
MFTPVFISGVILALTGSAAAVPPSCDPNLLSIEGAGGGDAVSFEVALADTPDTLSRGLMMVDDMPADAGMLFIFPHTGEVSFWMKNTLIPLDMLFIDEAGYVSSIHENAIPHDTTSIRSDGDVRYVLEINGGLSEALDLSVGDRVVNLAMGTGCAKNTKGAE